MIYRVLGVLSLAIGGVFGVVTMLVLLPFLDNFNLTLLILAGVFAILAYVFLAIGLQLFHPPEDRGRRSSEQERSREPTPLSVAAGSSAGTGPAASASEAEGGPRSSVSDAVPPPVIERAAVPPPVIEAVAAPPPVIENALPRPDPDSASVDSHTEVESDESSNGGAPLGRPTPPHVAFKKPGAAVPRD